MANSKLPSWYGTYGMFVLNEQTAAAPVDLQDRLKGYLEKEAVLKEVVDTANALEHLQRVTLELIPGTHGVQPGDDITIERKNRDPLKPWLEVGILNEGMIIGDIDIDAAAAIINESLAGLGTDEEAFAAVFGAIHKDAADRSVDVDVILKAVSKRYSELFGESLKDAIEGDFSGRAEVTSLIIAGQQVDPSFWRGFNPLTVLGDVALLFIPVAGWAGLAAKYGIKGVVGTTRAANLAAKASNIAAKANKLKTAAKATKLGKIGSKAVNPIKQVINKRWVNLNSASKIKSIKRGGIDIGSKIPWTSANKGKLTAEVVEFLPKTGQATMKFSNGLTNQVTLNNFLAQAGVEHSTKVAKAAGLIKSANPKLLLAAGVATQQADAMTTQGQGTNFAEKTGEFLGWYDSATADPDAEYSSYKDKSASELAAGLRTSVKGWTSNSEELSISLMILALEKEGAMDLAAKWSQMYPEDEFSTWVIESELEYDMAVSVGCYWAALTGSGVYNDKVVAMHARINPNAVAPVVT